MDVTRVTSWAHLQEELYRDCWDPGLGRHRGTLAFRGHSDAAFRLETSLMRLGSHHASVEDDLVRAFRKYAHLEANPGDSQWHWLALAQHHGLPTRLLDWTHSPYVALHFATRNLSRYDRDGAIWIVDYKKAHRHLPIEPEEGGDLFTASSLEAIAPNLAELDRLVKEPLLLFFEPPSLDSRIVNQFALFSIVTDPTVAVDTWLERHPDLGRVLILPRELKWEVRDKLDQANLTERVFFPGLDGLSAWLRRYYSTGPPTGPPESAGTEDDE
jgi:hypothetical protein